MAPACNFRWTIASETGVYNAPIPGARVKIRHYKKRLLELEKTLSASIGRAIAGAREQNIDTAHDSGDSSVAEETASDEFTVAELDSTVLQQVRDALTRIERGTFGTCVVDGGPIETKRLDAVPWTPYCLQHQQLLEASASS